MSNFELRNIVFKTLSYEIKQRERQKYSVGYNIIIGHPLGCQRPVTKQLFPNSAVTVYENRNHIKN